MNSRKNLTKCNQIKSLKSHEPLRAKKKQNKIKNKTSKPPYSYFRTIRLSSTNSLNERIESIVSLTINCNNKLTTFHNLNYQEASVNRKLMQNAKKLSKTLNIGSKKVNLNRHSND